MHRVSSNLTLFFKIFIPTFWIVFFGAFTLMIFLNPSAYYGEIPGNAFRIGMIGFFISGLLMLYFFLMRLKRVEMDEQFIYVTNYFKHYRYPYHNIEKIQESEFLFLKVLHIELKTPGNFGKSISFIGSKVQLQSFWKKHPELKTQFLP